MIKNVVRGVVLLTDTKPVPLEGHMSFAGVPVWKRYELRFTPDEMVHIHPGETLVFSIPWSDFWGARHGYPMIQEQNDGIRT